MTNVPKIVPADIPIPERKLLDNGTMFVTLPTLDGLVNFWNEHSTQFSFSCSGYGEKTLFLNEYEWVFGNSKSAVIETVLRWGKSEIDCGFFNFSDEDPEYFKLTIKECEIERKTRHWTDLQEQHYQVMKRDNRYGWWGFKNLPEDVEWDDLSSLTNNLPHTLELTNRDLSREEAAKKLFEQFFVVFNRENSHIGEIEALSHEQINEVISYWEKGKKDKKGYYGKENEPNKD